MSIEQLIRDLILEDQFKAKYTSRQRTIFCDNMYAKVSAFVEKTNHDRIDRIEELEEQLAVAQNDLEYYKEENKELNKNYKSVFIDMMAALRLAIYMTYLYAIWQYYNDNAERSIKDTNSTSDVPYNIE
jgi:hypothetical protein